VYTAVVGAHRAELVERRAKQRVHDRAVVSELLRQRAVLCGGRLQLRRVLMLGAHQRAGLTADQHPSVDERQPVSCGQELCAHDRPVAKLAATAFLALLLLLLTKY